MTNEERAEVAADIRRLMNLVAREADNLGEDGFSVDVRLTYKTGNPHVVVHEAVVRILRTESL